MSDGLKQRIEAAYGREQRPMEAGVDTVGQMTVAFCGGHSTAEFPDPY